LSFFFISTSDFLVGDLEPLSAFSFFPLLLFFRDFFFGDPLDVLALIISRLDQNSGPLLRLETTHVLPSLPLLSSPTGYE
jgi:hypothetical protein